MTHLHVYAGHDDVAAMPVVRKIEPHDLIHALELGIDDFKAMPSHLLFLGLVYPLCGFVLAYLTSQQNALQLIFPLVSGFALIGPFAAIGLYEMSRRRELGQDTSWKYALNVLRSPSIPAILVVGLLLMALFVAWLTAAQLLYNWLFGAAPPASYLGFLKTVLTTRHGWALIGIGGFVGFLFAVASLSVSVVSFPLLLDRDAGAAAAVATSVRAVRENIVTMALWGLIVSAALIFGSLPFFLGLVVVMPILGHATWHLYRAVIVRDPAQEHPVALPPKAPAAPMEPRSVIFPWR
jgi:uncharacterized membrane protein